MRLVAQIAGDALGLVRLDLLLERERQQGLAHARDVPQPHHLEPRGRDALEQVVHRRVRGRRRQDPLAPPRRALDDLSEHGGLAGPGRAVHQRKVLGGQGELERALLLGVER